MNKPIQVFPNGNLDASIVFVGGSPNRMDVSARKPFQGPGGHALMDCLANIQLSKTDCYFTYVIKDMHKHISQYISFGKTIKASQAFKDYCDALKVELSTIPSNIIVAVGEIALYALTNRRGITNWRGSILESTLIPGKKVVAIYDPYTVIPPGQTVNKYLILTDLNRVLEESKFPEIITYNANIRIEPSFNEVIEFLTYTIEAGERGSPITIDIEIVGAPEIDCISVSYDPFNVMSIPFKYSGGDYFTLHQEIAIWKILAAIIEDETIAISGQNIIFDLSFIFRRYGIVPRGKIYCTMIAQQILYPDFPAGLDFIASIYTKIPYYKKEGKEWIKKGISGSDHNNWTYNSLDSLVCSIALPIQLDELKEQKNMAAYKRKMNILLPLIYMSDKGIKVNIQGLKDKGDQIEVDIKKLEEKLWELVGYPINFNSPKQLMHYFYEDMKLQPYRKRTKDGWKPTADESAMKRIARKGIKEAQIILEIRKLSKMKSTYLNLSKISSDGRARCQYKPNRAKTGRYSSSADIFDEGSNHQNLPYEILTYYLPDDGYIYYAIDLGQAENRIVAYVGRVLGMIEAFESSIDLHRMTGGLIFNKPWTEVSDEKGSTTLGGGQHSERDWGKKGNHSLNYDFGYKAFSLKYEIGEKEGKWIVERYHNVYPEVRNIYHKQIRDQLAKDRTITNLFGRKRVFFEEWGDNLFKSAYAQIPQSTVADIIDERGIGYIYNNQDKFKEVELLIQIHDSIGFQLPISIPFTRHAEIIKDLCTNLEQPLSWNEREFVIPADLSMGLCLNKALGKEFKQKDLQCSIIELASKLSNAYKELKDEKTKM
jgi:uracil-DNA glycosylase family 4